MTIAVVQTATAYDPASGTCSFSSNTTAGNCVVVFIFTYALSSQVITTTGCTLGGSADHFQQAVAVQTTPVSGDTDYLAAWIDPGCAGGQKAVVASVTNATWQGQYTGTGLIIMELSGVAASGALDVTSASAPGATGTTASSGTTAGTSVAGEMALGAVIDANYFTGTDGSYTNITMGSPISCIAGYMQVPGAGTGVSYSAPANENNVVGGIVFTLRPAGTAPPGAPVITTASLPGAVTGTAYSAGLAASGGTPPYTWGISAGTLPAGLSLSTAGLVSGIPTTAGTSSLTVRVTDAASQTATQALTLTVTAAPPPPPPGTVDNSTLLYRYADGTEPASFTITGMNGTTPVTVAIATVSGGASALDPPAPAAPASAPSSTVIPASSITLADSGDWVLWFAGDEAGFGGPGYAITPPAGFTPQATNGATGTGGTAGSNAPPSLIQYAEAPSWGSIGAASTASLTWQAGDVIVILAATGDSGWPISSVPAATGLTFAAVTGALCNASGNCYANAWSATAAAAGSGAVSLAGAVNSGHWGMAAWVWRGSAGLGTVASSGTSAAASVRTESLARAGTDSCVTGGVFDWSGGSTSGQTWTPAATDSRDAVQIGTDYTAYVADWGSQGSPGTASYGIAGVASTGPFALVILEILGTTVPGSGTAGTNATVMVAVSESAPAGPTGSQPGSVTAAANCDGIMVGLTPGTVVTPPPPGGGTATPPSLISYAQTDWTSTGAKSTPSLSWQPGDIIIVLGASASSANPVTLGSVSVSNPGITTTSLPGAAAGTAYSATLAAAGGTPPYTWSISAGALPSWAALTASTGVISGTATGSGTASFTVMVTDAASGTATQALSIATTAALSVTTTSLPAAVNGTAWTATLTASGGTTPYTWSISAGTLPAWASLNITSGVITGTPNATGTTSFTARVTDAASRTATRALSIVVSAPASTAPNGPAGTWTLIFEDQFPGTSLNTANWTALQGASINKVSTQSSAVSVSGGQLNIAWEGAVNSNPASGYAGPSTGPVCQIGYCVEASISFPGSSGGSIANWPAWWTDATNWPAGGEVDIAEGLSGQLTTNYHSPSASGGSGNGPAPSGNWANSFHTYTMVRGSSSIQVYWDGVQVWSRATSDNGATHALIINSGGTGGSNSDGVILVDYVRVWSPG